MGFLNVVKGIIFRNEIAADVSADNGFKKLVEWLGLDSSKPKADCRNYIFHLPEGSVRDDGENAA